MREHEVPTHVQAEDRVLLGLTFPQIVAVTALCALAYGLSRYAPGPSEVRIALAVVFGLGGAAMIAGKIGGRALPLVAGDLLRFGLGPRRYAGPPSELVRSEPPPPAQAEPGPVSLMAERARRSFRRLRGRKRRAGERRNGRTPFRPHRWFGKRRRHGGEEPTLKAAWRRRRPLAVLAAAVLTVAAVLPQAALADEHWLDEIDFEAPEPVPGRRLFVEGLTVNGDRAEVVLRASIGLQLRTRVYGGADGRSLRFLAAASLEKGERIGYDVPLWGDVPSITFAWEDILDHAGAFTLEGGEIPHPLPSAEGELCDLRVASLGWAPGVVEGVVIAECAATVEERVSLQMVEGGAAMTALMDAEVLSITGTLIVAGGGAEASAGFIPNSQARFTLPVPIGEEVHGVTVEASLEAALRIAMPPLVRLTHHPERTERLTETVTLFRPGASDYASETITVEHEDGTTTEHTVSAYVYIPAETFHQQVSFTVVHPEHVRAEVTERPPLDRARGEHLALAASIEAGAPYEELVVPEPEETPPPGEQAPVTDEEAEGLFGRSARRGS